MVRVAVIDDDADFCEMIGEILHIRGWNILRLTADDEVIPAIRSSQPDAILLDIRLPEPGRGWTILDELRAAPLVQHIPVIICSADVAALREREAWLSERGIYRLIKPFDIADLYRFIEETQASHKPDVIA